jgi:putative Mn2+ efflux pump MntP
MMTFLFAPFALALDGFVVCTGLGPLQSTRRAQWLLSAAFGLCDALAMVIGATIATECMKSAVSSVDRIAPILIAGYGLYVLALAWSGRAIARGGVFVFLFPVLMSLDNFTAGLATANSPTILVLAFTMALTSGAMAYLGLRLGAALHERLHLSPAPFVGIGLILVAAGLPLI